MKLKVVLYGAGGHGKVVADMVEKQGKFSIAGFIDDRKTGNAFGYPILGTGADLARLFGRGIRRAIVSIGDGKTRKEKHRLVLKAGLELAAIVHPSAQTARGVEIGRGTVVMPGAVIGPDAKIGEGCIINTCASVDHDCRLGDFVHIAPGANLCGSAVIH